MKALLLERSTPLVCVHRCRWQGADGNSVTGLAAAIAAGAEMVEFDVRRSRDGVLYAWHDDRLPDGSVASARSYSEICSLFDRGSAPPEVEHLFATAAGRTCLHIDLKEDRVEQGLVPLALSYLEPARFLCTTGNDPQIAALKSRWPQVSAGLTLSSHLGLRVPRRRIERARRCSADLLSLNRKIARPSLLAQARALALPCLVWTVNDDAGIEKLLDAGVAAIVSDQAARALTLREAKTRA